jgi:hypothetical protein
MIVKAGSLGDNDQRTNGKPTENPAKPQRQ